VHTLSLHSYGLFNSTHFSSELYDIAVVMTPEAKKVQDNQGPKCVLCWRVAASLLVCDLLFSSWHSVLSGVVNPTFTLWCAAAWLADNGALVEPIDNVIIMTTLWLPNVSAIVVD
jgi:hypothetical protein